jgi:hypothetical protein
MSRGAVVAVAGRQPAVGVIDSMSTCVEHPDHRAQSSRRGADGAGHEPVIAGIDRWRGTRAGFGVAHTGIAYARPRVLADQAADAPQRLWRA